jgi:hypothetical protein
MYFTLVKLAAEGIDWPKWGTSSIARAENNASSRRREAAARG